MNSFVDFARSYGLILDDAVADGRWHRTSTDDKRQTKRNGAYKFLGNVGFVQNHATMQEVAIWKDGARAGYVDRSMLRARQAIEKASESARHLEIGKKAADMVTRAAFDTHPYLVTKGFPKERGLVLEGELLVPMREFKRYTQLNSLQRIAPDGGKKFLAGGKAKGSVFMIGTYCFNERYLCEGYATGLSIRAALADLHRIAQVVICFSAQNLTYIGSLLRPRACCYVIADNDKSGTGAQAAQDTGLPWAMPVEVGDDANDVHVKHGVRAVVNLLTQIDTDIRQSAGRGIGIANGRTPGRTQDRG